MTKLHSILDDLAEVLGFSATARLAAWFGDAGDLYVPAEADPAGILARLIGQSAARRLSQRWGGRHLAIPQLHAYEREVMRCRVGRLFERGCTPREVAWLERSTEGRVVRIRDELDAAGLLRVVGDGTPRRRRKAPLRRASDALTHQLQHALAGQAPAAHAPSEIGSAAATSGAADPDRGAMLDRDLAAGQMVGSTSNPHI